jgi:hypothetical protein
LNGEFPTTCLGNSKAGFEPSVNIREESRPLANSQKSFSGKKKLFQKSKKVKFWRHFDSFRGISIYGAPFCIHVSIAVGKCRDSKKLKKENKTIPVFISVYLCMYFLILQIKY